MSLASSKGERMSAFDRPLIDDVETDLNMQGKIVPARGPTNFGMLDLF